MKKVSYLLLIGLVAGILNAPAAMAIEEKPERGDITWRSAGASALSLFVWPGIGQIVNDEPEDKVITHAVLGLTGFYRFWSAYDALFDREGGYWKGRI